MNTCKTCKWWRRDDPTWTDKESPHESDCERREYFAKTGMSFIGSCLHVEMVYGSPGIKGVGCQDAEGYSAYMEMGEDFGCILHEPKQ